MRPHQRFWFVGLTTPIIYLVVCLIVNHTAFARRPVPGFWPLDGRVYDSLFRSLIGVGVAMLPLVYLLKIRWAGKASDLPGDEIWGLTQSPRGRRYFVIFILCDTIAVTGLILYLIQGRMTAMFCFGVLGLVAYGLAHPGE